MIDYEEIAAQSFAGFKPQENTSNQRSTSFSFSLQILTHEGLSLKGDMNMSKTGTAIPARASKPMAAPVTVDVEQEYDDKLDNTPPSALRFRSTQPQETKPRTTGPIVTPVRVESRVSGGTRFLLWVLLILCVMFLINGLVIPAVYDVLTQLKYGESRIATYDLDGKHWITEEANGRVRIIDSNPDGSHNQVLTTIMSGAPKHALVTLSEDGGKIDVSINGAYITSLVSDGNNGYKWSTN